MCYSPLVSSKLENTPLYTAQSSLAQQDLRKSRAATGLARKQGAVALWSPPAPPGWWAGVAEVFPSHPRSEHSSSRHTAVVHSHVSTITAHAAQPPACLHHTAWGRKPSPVWEAQATAPFTPLGKGHAAPIVQWGHGGTQQHPLVWSSGEEHACSHRTRLLLGRGASDEDESAI